MKITKFKNGVILALLTALLACVAAFSAVFATNSIDAQAKSTGTTNAALGTAQSLSKTGFQSLHKAITGGTTYTYNSLATSSRFSNKKIGASSYSVISAETIKTNNGNSDFQVSFGGYTWLLAFVSFANRTDDDVSSTHNGNVIATFILADVEATQIKYNTYLGGGDVAYPANMYGTSYVRSYLTGSKYSSGTGTAPSATYNSTNNVTKTVWQTFTDTYSKYLVQPKYVGWQEDQNAAKDTVGVDFTRPNDCYGTPYDPVWYNTKEDYNYTKKSGYGDWKNDYIWLPSLTELGGSAQNANIKNIWECGALFKTTDSATYWLRTGAHSTNTATHFLKSGAWGGSNPTSNWRVRPCIHVDLKVLGNDCGAYDTPVSADPTWSDGSTTYEVTFNNSVQYSLYSFTPPTGVSFYSYTTSASLYTSGSTRRLSATNAGTYYLSFKPDTGYCWPDYTNGEKSLTFKINKASVSELTSHSAPFVYNGTSQGRYPTGYKLSTTVNSPPDVNDLFASTYTGKTNAGVDYSSSTLPTQAGTYHSSRVIASGYTNNYTTPNYQTDFTINKAVVSSINWSQTTFAYNGSAQGPTVSSVNTSNSMDAKYKPASMFTLKYKGRGSTSYTESINMPTASGDYTVTATLTTEYAYNFTTSSTDSTATTITFDFTIGKPAVTVPYWYDSGHSSGVSISSDKKTATATYTGSSITFKAYEDEYMSLPTCPTGVTRGSYDEDDCYRYIAADQAGTYTITWSISSNYQWSDGSAYTVTKSLTIKINRSVVSATWTNGTPYTYSGNAQGPTVSLTATGSVPSLSVYYSGNYYTGATSTTTYSSSITKPTNAGTYSAKVTLTDTDNYTFSSSYADPTKTNSSTSSSVSFVINKLGVALPTWADGSTTYEVTYNGSEQFAHTRDWNTNTATLFSRSFSGTRFVGMVGGSNYGIRCYATVAGTYTLSLTPTANYKWSDNSTAAKSLTFTINRKDISSGVEWSTIADYTFSGNANTPEPLVTKIGNTSVTSTDMFSYSYADNVNAGTATVTVTGLSTGYYTGSYTLEFTINKAVVTGVTWGNSSFTYTGEEQCPKIIAFNTATPVNADVKPLDIFEITGGQINVGAYTAKATVPEDVNNFTLSETEFTTSYTIQKAVVTLTFTDKIFEYDGTAKCVTCGISVPESVIESARPTRDSFEITYSPESGSHVTGADRLAVDVGSYIEKWNLKKDFAKNFTLSATSQAVSEINSQLEITAKTISIVWDSTETSFEYDGRVHGLGVESFSGVPASGNSPFDSLIVTYYGGNAAITGKPVHVGEYKVVVEITDKNYVLDDGDAEFEITSVKYADKATLVWTDATDLTFTGKAQGPYLSADLVGAFAGADDNRTLNITLIYKTLDGTVLNGKPVNAGSYVMNVVESFGDYTFDDVMFEIKQRKVNVVWDGDELSRTTDGVIQWLYDGKAHKPTYTVLFDGSDEGVEIFRGNNKVETLKLDYASRTAFGSQTAVAALAQDFDADGTDYNANFVIVTDAPKCDFEILKFVATYVEWYEYGATEPLTADAISALSYEYPSVYGAEGPKLSAYACAEFKEGVTIKIALNVTYPTSFTKYWWSGKEAKDPYEAVASFFSKDSASCEFDGSLLKEAADGTDKVFITFIITDIRTDLTKVTVIWTVGGVDLKSIGNLEDNFENGYGWVDGVFTFIYNGTAQYPVPSAVDDHGRPVAVKVLSSGKNTDVGVYSAILAPLASYEVSLKDSECVYAICAREITLKWDDGAEFVYNGTEQYPTATVASGALLVDLGHTVAYSVDGVNAGTHTVTACVLNADKTVNYNYNVNCATSAVKITPKPVSANDIEWTAKDAVGDFVWNYNGQPHCPDAKLFTTVNENKVEINLSVMGGATAAGSYVAYAILNPADPDNRNFTLVESETNPVAAIASREFEIARITLSKIEWFAEEGGDALEEIVYIYNGLERLPVAVGYTSDDTAITLNVFGGRTDVGTYTALITDDYGLATGVNKSKEFTIQPKPVTVVWQERDEKGEIHFTYDGTEKYPAVTVDGLSEDDYTVKGFVNAGSYVTEVTFLNANYTADGENTCEFIIDRAVVRLSWTGEQSYTPVDGEAGVMYWRYNAQPHGPVATGKFDTITFSASSQYRLIVSEQEISAGRYTAYAALDYGFAGNANFVLDNAEKTYVITPYELKVTWTGNVTDYEEGDASYGKIFRWTYDGTTAFAPTAKYTLWDGTEVVAEVHGARVSAGAGYVASVSLPENCVFATVSGKSCGSQTFEVLKCKIEKIVWLDKVNGEDITALKDFAYGYDGLSHLPVAIVDGTGEELIVTGARINAGSGYIATAALKDAGNYEFASGVNSTYAFAIDPMEVSILWIDKSDLGAYEWTYSGKFICPEAVLADAQGNPILDNGNRIPVTVTGGRIVAGNNYQATAQNTFTNYKFADGARLIMPFKIKPVTIGTDDFEWLPNGGTAPDDGAANTYVFTFNGTAQQPFAVCKLENVDISFAYTIKDSKGETVKAIIDVGEYTLSVKSTDSSYSVSVDTVKVIIKAMTVKAEWGETELSYNGTERAPEAWYVDAYGQTVALEVTGGVTTGDGIATAAMYETDNLTGNYVLDTDTANMPFTVAEKHYDDFSWDWTDDNEGEWKKGVTLFAEKRRSLSEVED